MLRLLMTGRWAALTLAAVAAAAACTALGAWQWSRAQDAMAAERAAIAVPVPIGDVVVPGAALPAAAIGRKVTVEGAYDQSRQLLVSSRSLDGTPGLWVLEPLQGADGLLVPVVRGWIPSVDAPGARTPQPEPVAVDGVLQPFESFYADAPIQPDGTLLSINAAVLAQAWGTQPSLVPGLVVLRAQSPMASPAPVPVPPTIAAAGASFPSANFFYAVQWWVFAAFAMVLWARWLHLEAGRIASAS